MIEMLPQEFWLQIYREIEPFVPELLEREQKQLEIEQEQAAQAAARDERRAINRRKIQEAMKRKQRRERAKAAAQ